MASGLLTGAMTQERTRNLPENDWRKRDPEFQEPRLSRNIALADLLVEIGYPHNVGPGAVAIAWVLNNTAVSGAIVGGRHPRQIEDVLPAAELRLTESELGLIDKFLQEHP